ncbi:MAG: hypothetical protein U0736_04430 [Gemmataceae bacterium]
MAKSSGPPDRPLTAEDFLRGVLRSGLVPRDELQAALRGVPADQRDQADALADHLVRNGKLTRFQSSKLLRGITQGLVMGPFQVLAPLGRGAWAPSSWPATGEPTTWWRHEDPAAEVGSHRAADAGALPPRDGAEPEGVAPAHRLDV